MNSRLLWAALFLTAATLLSAEPRTQTGSELGPVVVLISGTQGSVALWHENAAVRSWSFPGEFSCAVVLPGLLDRLEWDGEAAVLIPAGTDPLETARVAVAGSKASRVLIANGDGSTEVVKAVEGEEAYDAATAATEEE